jgi:hypothetical protein
VLDKIDTGSQAIHIFTKLVKAQYEKVLITWGNNNKYCTISLLNLISNIDNIIIIYNELSKDYNDLGIVFENSIKGDLVPAFSNAIRDIPVSMKHKSARFTH